MARTPTVSTVLFRGFLDVYAALGLNVAELPAVHAVPAATLDDPQARVPLPLMRALTREAAERSGDPAFGLHVGERLPLAVADLVAFATLSAPSLRDSLELFSRYMRVVSEGTRLLIKPHDGGGLRYCMERGTLPELIGRWDLELAPVMSLRFVHWITGQSLVPQRAHFEWSEPAHVGEYRRIFTCPMWFNMQETALVLSAEQAALRPVAPDPLLHAQVQALLEARLRSMNALDTPQGRVQAEIAKQMGPDVPHIEDVARALHVSVRTLQRQLGHAGTSYSKLVDKARRASALQQLRATNHGLAEVAFFHGFTSTSAFGRAVRRWTGMTPLNYRRKAG